MDELLEINLGTENEPRSTYIFENMSPKEKNLRKTRMFSLGHLLPGLGLRSICIVYLLKNINDL